MRHEQPKPPRDLAGYLEAMTRIVFSSGISWRVVEAKWPGIRDAFSDFQPERVARMTARDVDRLAKDTRVIRNLPKLEATVLNAKEVVAIGKAPGEKVPAWDEWEKARPATAKRKRATRR